MTPDERAAVAREVLTEAVEHMSARDAVVAAHELAKLRDERYPAPAAPVTVTVNGYAFSPVIRKDETWVESDGCCWRHDDHTGRGPLFSRIAADARRIAELEREVEELRDRDRTADDARGNLLLQTICRLPDVLTAGDWHEWLDAHRHQWLNDDRAFGGWIAERLSAHMTRVERERDEARRALDAMEARQTLDAIKARADAAFARATTSQGEEPECPAAAARLAATAPAPIPLGAVVVVPGESGSPYTYSLGGWIASHGDPYPYDDDSPWTFALTALYRATHPVADRATVERVARILKKQWSQMPLLFDFDKRAVEIIRALGWEVAE